MASFKISAPGRIVLSGEHIALHGKKFLATSLDLRTTLEFCELLNTPENIIKIEFPNINLERDISLELVTRFFSLQNVEVIISNPINMREYIKYLITVLNCIWKTHQQRFSLQIFFFLLYSIAYHKRLEIKPFRVKVSSNIPIRAGLGSSTSFAVCLAACFLHWQRLQSDRNHIEFNNADLGSIKRYTETCENIMQDYIIADVDAHVCTYGEIVRCQRIDHVVYNITPIDVVEMNILLIDSNINQNKYVRAKQMVTKNDNTPGFNTVLNALENATREMCKFLHLFSNSIKRGQFLYRRCYIRSMTSRITSCIEKNQRLLREYNFSTEKFDDICQIASKHGLAGKLTGFGGKYVYILLPPDFDGGDITSFLLHFKIKDFNDSIRTSINCKGVRIDN